MKSDLSEIAEVRHVTRREVLTAQYAVRSLAALVGHALVAAEQQREALAEAEMRRRAAEEAARAGDAGRPAARARFLHD